MDCAEFCRTQSEDASDRNTHFEIYTYTFQDKREYHRKLGHTAEPDWIRNILRSIYSLNMNCRETLAGAASFVRWGQDPVEGMMPLYEFIPLFEQRLLRRQIDYFVFESVLELIRNDG